MSDPARRMGATEKYASPCLRTPCTARARRGAPLRGTRTRGFTFPELLAVLCIVVLLLATFVPYALSLRETANRQACAENLRKIGWAFRAYAEQNHYAYPRTRFDEKLGNRWTAFTGSDDADPFAAASAVQANDVSASLWLLVRTVDAQPEWFVCPSSDGSADRLVDAKGRRVEARQRGNFRGAEHLTYAIASPFSAVPDYALNDTLPAMFVLMADQGPSVQMLAGGRVPRADAAPRALAMGNSVNHRRAGQNVLYPQGTVIFETTPYVGVGRVRPTKDSPGVPGDNIYTALAGQPLVDAKPPHAEPGVAGANVGPAYRYDSYLVPAADFAALAATEGSVTRPTTGAVTTPPSATTEAAAPATAPAAPSPVAAPSPATAPAAATAPATTQAQ